MSEETTRSYETTVVSGLVEGDRLSWRTAAGEEISGGVLMPHPPIYLGGSLEQANDS
jgi:hypothetical protein